MKTLFAAVHMSPLGTKLLNARALVCPEELAKADMRPFRRDSAFRERRKRVDLTKMTHQRHWRCTAAMALLPVSAPIKVLV
jgi:hypothetical protein